MRWLSVCALVGIAILPCACGSDDEETTQGAAGATGSGGGQSAAGAAGAAGAAAPSCDENGNGACQNTTDCPFIEDGTATAKSRSCGLKCIADASRATCVANCFTSETTMTAACSTCYGNLLDCVITNCFNQCATASDSAECDACRVSAGCDPAYRTCSGLPGE